MPGSVFKTMVVNMFLMIILIFWLGGTLIPHDTVCIQELHDMFLQFRYPLWPQNLPLVWLVVSLIPSGVHFLHLWWKSSFVVKTGSVLHWLQSAFVLPWMMLRSLKSLIEVWLLFVILKKWLSISLFIKKNYACLLLIKKNWMSWILGIFIILLYILHVYFFFY